MASLLAKLNKITVHLTKSLVHVVLSLTSLPALAILAIHYIHYKLQDHFSFQLIVYSDFASWCLTFQLSFLLYFVSVSYEAQTQITVTVS